MPVAVAMVLDAGVTLAMQPAAYWQDHSQMQEGNPTWEFLLQRGPAVFLAGFILYIVAIGALLFWLTSVLQKLLGMFVLLAHTYGAASWAHLHPNDAMYWWLLMGVIFIEAIAYSLYWWLRAVHDETRPQCLKPPPP